MKIVIHEFDEDNRFFKEKGAKFFPQLKNRTLNKTEINLSELSTWGIVPRAIHYKSILNYDCIVSVGRIAEDSGESLFIYDKCLNPYIEIAKYAGIPFIAVVCNRQDSLIEDLELFEESYHYKQPIIDVKHLETKLKEFGITKSSKVLLLNGCPTALSGVQKGICEQTYRILKEYR
nr:MAG TPA: hypothetical protein [Caudoviricetes sp.]